MCVCPSVCLSERERVCVYMVYVGSKIKTVQLEDRFCYQRLKICVWNNKTETNRNKSYNHTYKSWLFRSTHSNSELKCKKKHRINGIQTNVPVHVCIQTYLYTFWETHLFGWWGKLKLLHHISHHAPHKYLKFGVRVGKVHRHTMGKNSGKT